MSFSAERSCGWCWCKLILFLQLYSLVAQIDNHLNAKMAASTQLDSLAMKTLAFMATLFLPGTFVAVRPSRCSC